MKKRKSLILYILLNIIVSALTVTLVLFIWEKTHPTDTLLPSPTAINTSNTLGSATTITPSITSGTTTELKLSIEAVFGVGDLSLEYILIRNNDEQPIDLTGWQIVGSKDESYTFPNLRLNHDGAVRLYSKSGTDSVIELYWGAQQALWSSGDELLLLDPAGVTYSTYQIP